MFIEVWQNSLKNTSAGVSFLIKLQALACNFIKKETLVQVFSCEFCEISENVFSYRTPPLATSKRAIWFSDKELKERETERERQRERDLKSTAADKDSITISYINGISRRDHSIDISDNIYGCLSGLSCRCFLMNFWIVSDSASSFLTALRRSCSWLFWNFRNNTLEKQCDEV